MRLLHRGQSRRLQQQEQPRNGRQPRRATRNEPSRREPMRADSDERQKSDIGCEEYREPELRPIYAGGLQPVRLEPRNRHADESAERPQKHCSERGHQRARFCGLNICHGEPAKNELQEIIAETVTRTPARLPLRASVPGNPLAACVQMQRWSPPSGSHRHGCTMILVCASGLARSAKAFATPSMPTSAVTMAAASTCPSAMRRSDAANSSGV